MATLGQGPHRPRHPCTRAMRAGGRSVPTPRPPSAPGLHPHERTWPRTPERPAPTVPEHHCATPQHTHPSNHTPAHPSLTNPPINNTNPPINNTAPRTPTNSPNTLTFPHRLTHRPTDTTDRPIPVPNHNAGRPPGIPGPAAAQHASDPYGPHGIIRTNALPNRTRSPPSSPSQRYHTPQTPPARSYRRGSPNLPVHRRRYVTITSPTTHDPCNTDVPPR